LLGFIYLFKRQHDEAIKAGERAIELNPNGANAYVLLAFILIYSDNVELAIKLIKRAFRLNPIPTSDFYLFLAIAYREKGQYEKAIEECKKALSSNPDLLMPYSPPFSKIK
jgi:adenylate cyclase